MIRFPSLPVIATGLAGIATLAFAIVGIALISDGTDTEVLHAECRHDGRFLDRWRLERPTVLPRGARILMSLRGERSESGRSLTELHRPVSVKLIAPSLLIGGGRIKRAGAGARLPIRWDWSLTPAPGAPYGSHRVEFRHSVITHPDRIERLTDASGLELNHEEFFEWNIDVRHRSGLPIGFVRLAGAVLPLLYLVSGATLALAFRRRRKPPRGGHPILTRAEHATVAGIVTLNLIFPVGLFIRAMPTWSMGFAGEESPINLFSSIQCALLAVAAVALFLVTRRGRRDGSDTIRRAWPWLAAAGGFVLLSLDEQFEFHERAPRIFEPLGLFSEMLPFLALVGAVLTWFLLGDLRRRRRSLILFLVALVLALLLAIQDASTSAIFARHAVRRIQIVAEETGEIWAQALFGIAMVSLLFEKLRRLLR